jgi:hypothetical protein
MHEDDERGPLLVAPPSYLEIRNLLRKATGFPDRHPLLIGIDGIDGSGKSSVASWLSWQLQMPAIHLDMYIVRSSDPLIWRFDDLARALGGAELEPRERPVIVEGILLLHVLREIDRVPEFLVFVEKDAQEPFAQETGLRQHLDSYLGRHKPKETADYMLRWSSAEYDARGVRAHLARDD